MKKEITINIRLVIFWIGVITLLTWAYYPWIIGEQHFSCTVMCGYRIQEIIRVLLGIIGFVVLVVLFSIIPDITIKNPFYKERPKDFGPGHEHWDDYQDFLKNR